MNPSDVLAGSYDHRLVALSVLISILAAYAARDLSERISDARGGDWLAWLAVGAAADGIGTWSMHYTGMLAYRLPVPVHYDWPTVLLSLLVSITGSGLALSIVSRRKIGWTRAVAGGVVLGSVGISGMHYIGMAAMRLQGMHHYSPALVTLSVASGILVSLAAVTPTVLVPEEVARHGFRRYATVVIRGSANPVMHYTAMAAVTFMYSSELPNLSHAVRISPIAILGISVVPVMVIVVALVTSVVDRLQKQKTLLDELFEQAPQAVALIDANGMIVRANRDFVRLFGYTPREAVGRRLNELIVPEELQSEFQQFAELLSRGQRMEAESIRRRKDVSRLYVSIVHVPVSLPGGKIVAYAIYHDITGRKKSEEQLQQSFEKLRALTARLQSIREEERTRIAREIHDELGQALTGLQLGLSWLAGKLTPEQRQVQEKVNALSALVDTTTQAVRRISTELRPSVLDDLGLIAALEWLA